MRFDIDMDFDEGSFREAIADHVEDSVQEWIETEARDGQFECDCGSRSFDIMTWKNAEGEIKAAGVCRECNQRLEIEVDTSDIDDIRG